jgi:hypothetical protein
VNKVKVLILVFVLFFTTGYAQAESIWFSPLTAIPEDIAGTRSAVLGVTTYGDALAVTATQPITELDSKWIVLGLTTQDKKTLKGVQICYEVATGSPDSTYIAHVKLTTMTTPDFSTAIYDDSTNLASTTATCYTTKIKNHKPKLGGTTTLSLKMVFGSASDNIIIGGVQLIF